MKVQTYYTEGCPNYQKAYNFLQEVLEGEGVKAEIELIVVKTEEEARRYRFIGSPTIHINGIDVEPGARRAREFGLGCRVYLDNGAHQGYPPKTMLLKALKEAIHESGR